MTTIRLQKIAISKIFVDAVSEEIYCGNVRKAHGKQGPGYQRDPYTRMRWIEPRAEEFDEHLMRPTEVSPRSNGFFAAIDGGGRWVMAQLAGRTEMQCRVHEGLSREEEAKLFEALDSEVYKLRNIDKFLASMAAKEQWALAIAEAVRPYTIAVRGRGTLKCVGPLQTLYSFATPNVGLRLISRTAKILANTWGGCLSPGNWESKKQIDGKFFLAIALIIEAAGTRFDEAKLRKVLAAHKAKEIEKEVLEMGALKQAAFAPAAAKLILQKYYNRGFQTGDARKIGLAEIDNSEILAELLDIRIAASKVRKSKVVSRPQAVG